MIFSLNAGSARLQSSNSLNIYNEISEIFKKIIIETQNGNYDITIKNTPMTFTTPKIKIIGTVTNPVIQNGDTININGDNIILGTSGLNLNSVISDINDANIEGLLASKENNKLVLEYTVPENNWQIVIGGGTANTALGIPAQIYIPDQPTSVEYFNVWSNLVSDRKLKSEMDMVVTYFEKLGYSITRRTNLNTSNTFEWIIQW
jgi:hypothetical protein